MHRFIFAATIVGLPAAGHAAAAPAPVARLAAAPDRPGWFVCDALNSPLVAFVGKPGADRAAAITMIDRRSGTSTTQTFTVGNGEPGAGNLYWSLSKGGKEVGNVHAINSGIVTGSGPGALPPMQDVTIGKTSLACRWLGNMRFLGVGKVRTVTVTEEDGKLVYRSFDYAKRGPEIDGNEGVQTDKPTLVVNGGSADGAGDWRFGNNGYALYVSTAGGAGPASVRVTHEGRPVGNTPFLAFEQVSAPARLSRADVWSGAGVEACRALGTDVAMTDCVIAAMRRTGATPATIAYARTLAAQDTIGWLSAWRQVGPVGIATLTYPFRANTNDEPAIVPADGPPILVDRWQPTAADMGRADWRRLAARHPQSSAFPPGVVAAGGIVPGRPFAIRVRTPWRDCHACAPDGAQVVRYGFDAGGRLTGSALESVG